MTANYIRTHIDNADRRLPGDQRARSRRRSPTASSAMPNGDADQLDPRPVNFASEVERHAALGFNRVDSAQVDAGQPVRRACGAAGRRRGRAEGRPGGGARRRRARRGGGGGGGGSAAAARRNGGRLQFAVYHSVYFRDTVLIRPGVPVLDLLNGGALGTNGGQPRHEVDVQAGYARNGLGARLSANWRSGTRVDASAGDPNGALTFSPLATANLRLFANLGQMPGWSRISRGCAAPG